MPSLRSSLLVLFLLASFPAAPQQADSAAVLPTSVTTSDTLITSVTKNAQFIAASSQTQEAPPNSAQIAALDDDLFGDKPAVPDASDIWRGMKTTANDMKSAAGDVFNSHPMQWLAQKVGLAPDPGADPVDSAVHTCGVSMLAGAAPYPAGMDAATVGCMNAVQQQGMRVLGMASDQMVQH